MDIIPPEERSREDDFRKGVYVISGAVTQDIQEGTSELDNEDQEADLETAITKCGFGKFNIALLLLSFPTSFTPGFETGSLSYVIPAASHDLDLTPDYKAMLQSASFAGMVASGFLWGSLSDAFGRKKLLVLGFISDAIFNVLAGAFPNLSLMITFKFVSGFMFCGTSSIFTAYISEVFMKKGRNLAVLSMGMYGAIGQIVLASLAMWIIPSKVPVQIPFKSWQLFQMVCALPSLISGIGCIFFVESPKFLADKGNNEKALKVCQTIYSINTGNSRDSFPIKKLRHKSRVNKGASNLTKFLDGLDIFKPPFINKAIIIFLIHLGSAGLHNILRLWLPEMLSLVSSSSLDPKEGLCPLLQEGNLARSNLTSEQLKNEDIYGKMMMINAGSLVGHLCFLLIVSLLGKKIIEFGCAVVAGITSFIIPLINVEYVIVLTSVTLTLYQICMSCNKNIVVEIFPTRIRATSISVLLLIARIGTFSLNFVIANIMYNNCQNLFYGLTIYSIVMAALILLLPKKPIEDRRFSSLKLNGTASQEVHHPAYKKRYDLNDN